ncbi:TIGR01777 family oxidoreductase [Pontimicrobium sp. IMCC45349]|uniref:TIGR01777 family oxidoreductase n=1 Tax=Pontimicrobium sp. IMCC45349 TaxID=3391574 RepID=UPI0039A08A92
MNRILITGATGLVGQEIVKQCHAVGIHVNYLSTNKEKLKSTSNYKGFYWNPKSKEIDVNCFKDIDTIINLAGASIAKRWTSSYKKEILESRIDSLKCLYDAIEENNIEVSHLVSASAIGIYPSSKTHYYDESNKDKEEGFLSNVVEQWEDEVDTFANLNVKVSKIRIGIVLAKKGGALTELVKPVKLFLGSPLGTGKQWQSWIHIEDLASMFLYVIKNKIEGVLNGVAPNPVKQKELIKLAAKQLNRPVFLPNVPSFVLKIILGEMSSLLLESQRVSSKKIESLGYHFKYHHLQPALKEILG